MQQELRGVQEFMAHQDHLVQLEEKVKEVNMAHPDQLGPQEQQVSVARRELRVALAHPAQPAQPEETDQQDQPVRREE